MIIGFSLVTSTPCDIVDIYLNEDDKTSASCILVYEDDVDVYRDSLIRVRCTRNQTAFDMDRQKGMESIDTLSPLYVMFYECKSVMKDYVGVCHIVDKTFKTVFIDMENKSHKGKVKSGYKEIDSFINDFFLVDLDNDKLYIPYNNPFNRHLTNDLDRFVASYGKSYTGYERFKYISSDKIVFDGIEMSIPEFHQNYVSDFYTVFFDMISNTVLKTSPMIVITKDENIITSEKAKICPRTDGYTVVITR